MRPSSKKSSRGHQALQRLAQARGSLRVPGSATRRPREAKSGSQLAKRARRLPRSLPSLAAAIHVEAGKRPVLGPHQLPGAGLDGGALASGSLGIEERHRRAGREPGGDQVGHLLVELIEEHGRGAQRGAGEAEERVRPAQLVETPQVKGADQRHRRVPRGPEDADLLDAEGVDEHVAPAGLGLGDHVPVGEVPEPGGGELVVERGDGLRQRVVCRRNRGVGGAAGGREDLFERARGPGAQRRADLGSQRPGARLLDGGVEPRQLGRGGAGAAGFGALVEGDEEVGGVGAERAGDERVPRGTLGDAAGGVSAPNGRGRRGRRRQRRGARGGGGSQGQEREHAGGHDCHGQEPGRPPRGAAGSGASGARRLVRGLDGGRVVALCAGGRARSTSR